MFEQITLDYGYDGLEPHIDALTVETHYAKHHATYTANFNKALEKAGIENTDAVSILDSLDSVKDETDRIAIRNNGGGYFNHNLYFENFSANPAKEPVGKLKAKIDETFGSLDALKEKLTALATGQFGSGWAWLSVTPSGDLVVSNSANQDNPISLGTKNIPILALDVWEHAYYLKYKNLRGDYIKAFFEVLDWEKVSRKYSELI